MYNCNRQCNRLCPHLIISQSLTVVTVDGTDTLLIDIPAGTYAACETYCIIIAQNRPTTATVDMPVAISIGGVTTTVYPLVCCKTGLQAVACQVNGRTKIKTLVQTNTTSGVFKALCGLGDCCINRLRSLPVVETAAAPATPTVARMIVETASAQVPNKTTKTVTTTTKEVIANE